MSDKFFFIIGNVVFYGLILSFSVLAFLYVSSRLNQYLHLIGRKKWFFKIWYLRSYWDIKNAIFALERIDKDKYSFEDRKQIKGHLDDALLSIRKVDCIFKENKDGMD